MAGSGGHREGTEDMTLAVACRFGECLVCGGEFLRRCTIC